MRLHRVRHQLTLALLAGEYATITMADEVLATTA
jgi:hypothetical protein